MAGANAPYYQNTKQDDIDVWNEADAEAIETGFSNVDADKADKITPGSTGNLAGLSAEGNLQDSGKQAPSGTIVGTTDTQTLANKTLDDSAFTGSIGEQTYSATGSGGALNPENGTLWKYTMNATTTFTDSLSNGEYIWMHLLGGDTYSVTWPTVTWLATGTAPTLTAEDLIVFWKIDSELFASYAGTIA